MRLQPDLDFFSQVFGEELIPVTLALSSHLDPALGNRRPLRSSGDDKLSSVGSTKRTLPGIMIGGPSRFGIGCPTTVNWKALSVAIDNIEPTDVTFRRNLVIFFIF